MNKDRNLDLRAIQAGAVILASSFSLREIEKMDNEALYRFYNDRVNRYFQETRHGVLFNGQIIGEASLEEESLEKELFMTYLFWPNDEEFLNIQMTKSELVTKMLKGVNYRFDYLRQPEQAKAKAEVLEEAKTKDAPVVPLNDDLVSLAQGALVSFKNLNQECQDLRMQMATKDATIAKQNQDLEFLRKEKEENKAKANEYINELMAKIEALQSENTHLSEKVARYEQVMPNVKEILSSMQSLTNPEVEPNFPR